MVKCKISLVTLRRRESKYTFVILSAADTTYDHHYH